MTLTTQTAAWRQTLSAGHVVSFTFPCAEGDDSLEKNRPALILAVDRSGPKPMATVAYGTSRRTDANTGLELHVRRLADLAAAGLHRRTRFVGARTAIVPLTSPRFVTCRAGTAIFGALPAHLHPRLADVAARCHIWRRKDDIPSRRTRQGRRRRDRTTIGESAMGHGPTSGMVSS